MRNPLRFKKRPKLAQFCDYFIACPKVWASRLKRHR